jgi:hypothetical protein
LYTKPPAAVIADVLFKEWSAMVWVLRAVEASIGKPDSFPCCSSSTHQRYMCSVMNLSLHVEFGWQFLLLQECLLLLNAISNFLCLRRLNCTRKLHCREILQSFGLEDMMMLTLDSVAANALSFLWHTVMQSWLQISSFKPCFASVAAYTLLSYGTLSCNPSFRFDLQTLFCFCCCTCTFFLMAHCHAILASDSSFKPCFDSVAANALLFMSLRCAILASDFKLQTLFFFCCCKCTFFLMALCHAILASDFKLQTPFFLLVEISVPFCQA